MTRAAKIFWIVCFLVLPVAAFGQYPLTGPPDIYVDNISYSYIGSGPVTALNLSGSSVKLPNGSVLYGGAVESISDIPGTYCDSSSGIACQLGGLSIVFNADATGFTITGQTIATDGTIGGLTGNDTTTYLSGSFVSGSYNIADSNANYDTELFTVGYENQTEMNLLEENFPGFWGSQPASDLVGDEVFFDLDTINGNGSSNGDMELVGQATPEPATLTLLCSGLAAGLLRKKLARKKV